MAFRRQPSANMCAHCRQSWPTRQRYPSNSCEIQLATVRLIQNQVIHDAHANLNATNEALVIAWIEEMQAVCHCVTPYVVHDKADLILLERSTKRRRNSKSWIQWTSRFLKRHPAISLRRRYHRRTRTIDYSARLSICRHCSHGNNKSRLIASRATNHLQYNNNISWYRQRMAPCWQLTRDVTIENCRATRAVTEQNAKARTWGQGRPRGRPRGGGRGRGHSPGSRSWSRKRMCRMCFLFFGCAF